MTQLAHHVTSTAIAAAPDNTAPPSAGAKRRAAPDRPPEKDPPGTPRFAWPHDFLSLRRALSTWSDAK
jgi:hypothetical protein